MITRDGIAAALGNSNVVAWLTVIRSCEGTLGADGYRALFGWRPGHDGSTFDSFADHPRVRVPYKQTFTTAAGAYQILAGTWDDYAGIFGPSDFSPPSQDACAVFLTDRRGALDDVVAGKLDDALRKCGAEWASLPGSPYGQPTRTREYCHQVFIDAGGTLAGAAPMPQRAPAPVEEVAVPAPAPAQTRGDTMGAVFLALLPTLLGMIPQLAQIFKPGTEVAQRNVQAGTIVADTIIKATQQPNLQAAVEAMQADPAVAATAKAAVLNEPAIMALMEVGGGGIAAARKQAADPNQLPFYKNSAWLIAIILSPLIYMVVYRVLWGDAYSEQLRTVVVTAILSGLLGSLTGFFFGSSYAQRPNGPSGMRSTDG